MDSYLTYQISAMWQPRIESPREILDRFRQLVNSLKSIDPLTRKWYHVNPEGACYDVDELGQRLIDTIIGRVAKGTFGEPEPWMGYHLIAYNCPDVCKYPHGLWVRGTAGGQSEGTLQIYTNFEAKPDPRVIAFRVFKAISLAIADAFEPDWVSAGPSDLLGFMDMRRYARPPMPIAWMIDLSPSIAQLIQSPSGVISERRTDGRLFMAATAETFVTGNSAHFAAARLIHAVVDPLNYSMPFKTLIDWVDPQAQPNPGERTHEA